MPDAENPETQKQAEEFVREAEEAPLGLIAEFWDFVIHNKKWWLIPLIVVLLLVTALVIFAGSPMGPFIYPVF